MPLIDASSSSAVVMDPCSDLRSSHVRQVGTLPSSSQLLIQFLWHVTQARCAQGSHTIACPEALKASSVSPHEMHAHRCGGCCGSSSPQASQMLADAWFLRVHIGQATVASSSGRSLPHAVHTKAESKFSSVHAEHCFILYRRCVRVSQAAGWIERPCVRFLP